MLNERNAALLTFKNVSHNAIVRRQLLHCENTAIQEQHMEESCGHALCATCASKNLKRSTCLPSLLPPSEQERLANTVRYPRTGAFHLARTLPRSVSQL